MMVREFVRRLKAPLYESNVFHVNNALFVHNEIFSKRVGVRLFDRLSAHRFVYEDRWGSWSFSLLSSYEGVRSILCEHIRFDLMAFYVSSLASSVRFRHQVNVSSLIMYFIYFSLTHPVIACYCAD